MKTQDQVWPYVKKHVYANGAVAWCVDARTKHGGKRSFHPTKPAAEAQARIERIARQNDGSDYEVNVSARSDLNDALYLLRDYPGVTLLTAVRFYCDNNHIVRGDKTVLAIAREYINGMHRRRLRARTIEQFESKIVNGFCSIFGSRPIASITRDDVQGWLDGLAKKCAPLTINNYRTHISALFTFALKQEPPCVLRNPVQNIDSIKIEGEEVKTLKVDQVKALLAAALELSPESVPMIALNVFAGFRPEAESFRSDWKYIDVKNGYVRIHGSRSKNSMSTRRFKMSDNLIAWLRPYAQNEGSLGPSGRTYYNRLETCRTAAGITEWPQDVLRHTFASMHLAHYDDIGETAKQLGHGESLQMLIQKYRNGMVTPEEAAEFWRILP
jgi:integrase/recombinase XerD